MQPDEGQAEEEHNGEPSHGLGDWPNGNEATTGEGKNQEPCLESSSEDFTGESRTMSLVNTENATSEIHRRAGRGVA